MLKPDLNIKADAFFWTGIRKQIINHTYLRIYVSSFLNKNHKPTNAVSPPILHTLELKKSVDLFGR